MVKTKAGLLKRVGDHVARTPSKLPAASLSAVDVSDTELMSKHRENPDIFVRMPCSQQGQRRQFRRELWLFIEGPSTTAVLVFLSQELWNQAQLSDIHSICVNIFNLQLLPPSHWQLRAAGQPLDPSVCTLGDLGLSTGGALRWCQSHEPTSTHSSQDSAHTLFQQADTAPSVNLRLSPAAMAALRPLVAPSSQPADSSPRSADASPPPQLTPHKSTKRTRSATAATGENTPNSKHQSLQTPARKHARSPKCPASPAAHPAAATPHRPASKISMTPATPSDMPSYTPLRPRRIFATEPTGRRLRSSTTATHGPPACETPLKPATASGGGPSLRDPAECRCGPAPDHPCCKLGRVQCPRQGGPSLTPKTLAGAATEGRAARAIQARRWKLPQPGLAFSPYSCLVLESHRLSLCWLAMACRR
eukprot:jgi/Ulvmu1/8633/UM046_0036.1